MLYSKKPDRNYIGCTGDTLEERLRKHNTNHRVDTGKTNAWYIAHTENYKNKSKAYQRELENKKRKSRKYIDHPIRAAG